MTPQQLLEYVGQNIRIVKVIKFQTIIQTSQIPKQLNMWIEKSKTLIDNDVAPTFAKTRIIDHPSKSA